MQKEPYLCACVRGCVLWMGEMSMISCTFLLWFRILGCVGCNDKWEYLKISYATAEQVKIYIWMFVYWDTLIHTHIHILIHTYALCLPLCTSICMLRAIFMQPPYLASLYLHISACVCMCVSMFTPSTYFRFVLQSKFYSFQCAFFEMYGYEKLHTYTHSHLHIHKLKNDKIAQYDKLNSSAQFVVETLLCLLPLLLPFTSSYTRA